MAILKPHQKRLFNVTSKEDLAAFNKFYTKQAWGPETCPFMLEEPYKNIPSMCIDKIVTQYLKAK